MAQQLGSSTINEIIFRVSGVTGAEAISKLGERLASLNEEIKPTIGRSDEFSKSITRSGDAAKQAGIDFATSVIGMNQGKSALEEFGDIAFKMNNIMSQVQPVMDAFKNRALAAWEAGSQFGQAIANMQTILDNPVEGGKEMADVLERILAVTSKDPEDVYKGGYDALSAGFTKAADAAKVLDAANRLAVAGLGQVTEGVDVITSALNAYGLSADSAQRVAESIFIANKIGKATLDEIAEGYGKIIPIAALVGVQIDEVNASIGVLTQTGLSAAEAETNLRMALLSVIKPTKEMSQLISDLGYASGDGMIKAIGLRKTLMDLSSATMGSQEAFSRAFSRVQGLTAATLLGALRSTEFGKALDMTRAAADAAGTSVSELTKAVELQSNSLENTWKRTQAAYNALKRDQLEAFEPIIRSTLQVMQDMANAWNKFGTTNPFEGFIKSGFTLTAALAGVGSVLVYSFAFAFGKIALIYKSLQHISGEFIGIATGMRSYLLGIETGQAEISKQQTVANALMQQALSEQNALVAKRLVLEQRIAAAQLRANQGQRLQTMVHGPYYGGGPFPAPSDREVNLHSGLAEKSSRESASLGAYHTQIKADSDAAAARTGRNFQIATEQAQAASVATHKLRDTYVLLGSAITSLITTSLLFADRQKLVGDEVTNTQKAMAKLIDNPIAFAIIAQGFVLMTANIVGAVKAMGTFWIVYRAMRTGLVNTFALMSSGTGVLIANMLRLNEKAAATTMTFQALAATRPFILTPALLATYLVGIPALIAGFTTLVSVWKALNREAEQFRKEDEQINAFINETARSLEGLGVSSAALEKVRNQFQQISVDVSASAVAFHIATSAIELFVTAIGNAGRATTYVLDSFGAFSVGSGFVALFHHMTNGVEGYMKRVQQDLREAKLQENFELNIEPDLQNLRKLNLLSDTAYQLLRDFYSKGLKKTPEIRDALAEMLYQQARLDETTSHMIKAKESGDKLMNQLAGLFTSNDDDIRRSFEAAANRGVNRELIANKIQQMNDLSTMISKALRELGTLPSGSGENSVGEAAKKIPNMITAYIDASMLDGKSILGPVIATRMSEVGKLLRENLLQMLDTSLDDKEFGEQAHYMDAIRYIIDGINSGLATIAPNIEADRMAAAVIDTLDAALKSAADNYAGRSTLATRVAAGWDKILQVRIADMKAGGKTTPADLRALLPKVDASALEKAQVAYDTAVEAIDNFNKSPVGVGSPEWRKARDLVESNLEVARMDLITGTGNAARVKTAIESLDAGGSKTLKAMRKASAEQEQRASDLKEIATVSKEAFTDALQAGDLGSANAAAEQYIKSMQEYQNAYAKVAEIQASEAGGNPEMKAALLRVAEVRKLAAQNAQEAAKYDLASIVTKMETPKNEILVYAQSVVTASDAMASAYESMGESGKAAGAMVTSINASIEIAIADIAAKQALLQQGGTSQQKDEFSRQIAVREAELASYREKLLTTRHEEDNLLELTGRIFVGQVKSAGDMMQQYAEVGAEAIGSFSDAIVDFAFGAKINFADMAKSIVSDLIKIQLRMALMNIATSLLGGGGGGFQIGTSGVYSPAGGGPNILQYDTGGFVGNGGRKVQVTAHEGEGIFTPRQMNNADNLFQSLSNKQSSGMNVVINNYGNDDVQANKKRGPGGEEYLEVVVKQLENKMSGRMDRGTGFAPYLEQTYGMTRTPGRNL